MLKNKVIETIKKYRQIETGDSLIIGVSGGPDSICLLHILSDIWGQSPNSQKGKRGLSPFSQNSILGTDLYVAHVNHMIRKEADAETEYVEEFCKRLGIKCFTKKVDVKKVAKNEKISEEEAGRKVRYEFFDEVMNITKSNKIATAHNANDNVETVLMNIIRGTGLSGLKGITPTRDKYIRPLIEITREEIEEYCEKNNLEPKYDETNKENIYTRNKIRNELIPYIKKEYNPNIVATLNRLSELALGECEYLEDVVRYMYEEVLIEKVDEVITLNLTKFNKLELIIKRRLILYVIKELLGEAKDIGKIHIDDIIKLCNNNIGNKFLIPNKKVKILVKSGKVFYCKN